MIGSRLGVEASPDYPNQMNNGKGWLNPQPEPKQGAGYLYPAQLRQYRGWKGSPPGLVLTKGQTLSGLSGDYNLNEGCGWTPYIFGALIGIAVGMLLFPPAEAEPEEEIPVLPPA